MRAGDHTDGAPIGSAQVLRSVMPLVVMRDVQMTGGYPKIANVATIDGDKIRS